MLAWVWDRATTQVESHVSQMASINEEVKEVSRSVLAVQSDVNSLKGLRGQVQTLQEDMLQKGMK
jgi:hypothetical protein